jgi:restriction endonuclease S subunit
MPVNFVVAKLNNRTGRIDAHFFNPLYFKTIEQMEKIQNRHEDLDFLPIKDLLKKSKTNLTGGATPKGTPYVTEDEGIKFIRVQNVRKYRINTDDIVYIPRTYHNGMLKRSQLNPFDVLLTITGVTYGFSAVVPKGFGEANMNQHSVKIEVNDEKIIPEYMSCFLNSKIAKIQMDRLVTGGTRPALDYPSIKSINILYPKQKEYQKSIVNKTMELVNTAYKSFGNKKLVISSMDQKILALLGVELPNKGQEKYFLSDLLNSDRIDSIYYSPYYNEFKKY